MCKNKFIASLIVLILTLSLALTANACGQKPTPGASLQVDTQPVNFADLKPGTRYPSQLRSIEYTGDDSVVCTVSKTKPWLLVEPATLTATYGTKWISVWADTTGLPYGYADSDYITVKTKSGSFQIPVYLTTTKTNIIFEDDFSDPNSGWYVDSWNDADLKYQDGGYRITIKRADTAYIGINERIGQLDNFVVELDARWLTQEASSVGVYGISFRDKDEDNNYYFLVFPGPDYGPGKGYVVGKVVNGTQSTLTPETYSASINRGTATNRLKVVCKGTQISAYANGNLLKTITDNSLSSGIVAPKVYRFKNTYSYADALFDNFKITIPD